MALALASSGLALLTSLTLVHRLRHCFAKF